MKTEELKLWKEYKAAKRNPKKSRLESKIYALYDPLAINVAVQLAPNDEDAIQESRKGLLTGIRYFDPARGVAPTTYLYYASYNAVKTYRSKRSLGESYSLEDLPDIPKEQEEIPDSLNECNTPDDIRTIINQNKAGLPPRTIRILRKMFCQADPMTIDQLAVSSKKKKKTVVKFLRDNLARLKQKAAQ